MSRYRSEQRPGYQKLPNRRGPTTCHSDRFLAGKRWEGPWGTQRHNSPRVIEEVKRSDRVRAQSGQGSQGWSQGYRLAEKVIESLLSTLPGSRRSGEHIPQSLRTGVKQIRKYEGTSKLTRDARGREIK